MTKMTDDELKKKLDEFFSNIPTSEFNVQSRENYHHDPTEWLANKKTLLQAAFLNDDKQAIADIKEDIAHVLGYTRTELWALGIMEEFVAETNHDDNPNDHPCG